MFLCVGHWAVGSHHRFVLKNWQVCLRVVGVGVGVGNERVALDASLLASEMEPPPLPPLPLPSYLYCADFVKSGDFVNFQATPFC